MRANGNRAIEGARLARERELHLERLARVELRPATKQRASIPLRAGGGPPRPWTEKPPQKPGTAARRQSSARPHAGPTLTYEQREHQRNVASLYSKLQDVALAKEWRAREQREGALAAGRIRPTTAPVRRRVQAQTAKEATEYYRRLRSTTARFATPSAIALLTGKPAPGAGGSAHSAAAADDIDN